MDKIEPSLSFIYVVFVVSIGSSFLSNLLLSDFVRYFSKLFTLL